MVSISAGFVSSLVVRFLAAARDHEKFAPKLRASRMGFCVAWACKDRDLSRTMTALEEVIDAHSSVAHGPVANGTRYTFSRVAVNFAQKFPVEVSVSGTSSWEIDSSVAMLFGVIHGCPAVADCSEITAALTQIEGVDGAHLPFVEAVGWQVVVYDLTRIEAMETVPT